MAGKPLREVVIPKESAVFWLDARGRWHNEFGEIQHKRIKAMLDASIRRDKSGYHVFQINGDVAEKVYFGYEDCALFVVDVVKNLSIMLVLNTRKRLKLKPRRLFMRNDALYMDMLGEPIKFLDRALVKLSGILVWEGNKCFIRINNRRYAIKERKPCSFSKNGI